MTTLLDFIFGLIVTMFIIGAPGIPVAVAVVFDTHEVFDVLALAAYFPLVYVAVQCSDWVRRLRCDRKLRKMRERREFMRRNGLFFDTHGKVARIPGFPQRTRRV